MAGKQVVSHGAVQDVKAKYVNKSKVIEVKLRLDYKESTFGALGSFIHQDARVTLEADQQEMSTE